ncbi:MAG: hypothetical protein HYW06_06780 [Gemmatimonadetes bacterium]|nr:hypothetical protein [Gemmatimonadota bacterium]MBI2536657.1 hypothetical protein [Gemmatimonadota bacterium]
MADLTIARGTCYPLFAYDAAYAIDLDAAERRVLAAKERQTIKAKRRAPAFFEYRPPPLRVTQEGVPVAVGSHGTAPGVEVVLYDFGAVSASYAIPIEGPLAALPRLSADLWGNEALLADSRAHVERLLKMLGDAATRPRIAEFVEDYSVFQIEGFREACDAAPLWTEHAGLVAQTLRAAPASLSQQEVADAISSRLSFGPSDATFIDTDGALIFDPEGDDVRAVLEFANTQLLEMRFLDAQLDEALERAYGVVLRSRRLRLLPPHGPASEQLAQLQLDSAILFEQVTNALKLMGEQYLARVYRLVSRRFRIDDWDAAITRKLDTLESIYAKLTDRAAARRMETLEWIIIVLIAASILISLVAGTH